MTTPKQHGVTAHPCARGHRCRLRRGRRTYVVRRVHWRGDVLWALLNFGFERWYPITQLVRILTL